jgi:DNA-binding SARP family transcriptional activator
VARLAPALEISLLGPPRVRRAGRPVSFDTRKAMALLAHLALAERPRSREALCGLLWHESDPEHARAALRRTLSTLRKGVGEEWLDTAGDSVALREGAQLAIDVRRFRSLAADGASVEELAEAVELFRGDLLEGLSLRDSPEFEAWEVYEADLLQRELASALGRLVRLMVDRGDYVSAIAHAQRWLSLDPLHEPAHRELIRLYALHGDRAAALAQYRNCVRTLSQELGVPPVEETAALFEQVSEGTLAAPAPPAASRPPAVMPSELPLVGRRPQLAALLDAHRSATPDGRLVVIEGEAGIGKTRLARELIAEVEPGGASVLAARCHDDEAGLPYGAVLDLLAEALRRAPLALAESVAAQRLADAALLLPELAGARPDLPPPVALSSPGAHARLLEGVVAVLAGACEGSTPGLVFVDDVHGADEATLDVLGYLARRLRGRSLLLVVGWRSEGVPPGHRLRRLASELSRERAATIVALNRLDESDVAELVRVAKPGGAPELERRVFMESEGLPLFVAEYVAALDPEGGPEPDALPREMRSLLAARLGGLGAVARQMVETAAVIGRSFGLDTVRTASGRSDEEAVAGLDELVSRGLVRELDGAPPGGAEPAYDFTHDKLRALVYDEIGQARRRLLHRRVSSALARGPETAALVAQQLRLAGDHAGAAEQYRLAGEHAASLLAHADALEHLEAALALGDPDVAGLHERIGDLQTLVGDYAGALASYDSAAAEAGQADVARIEHKLGGVHQRRGEWERAEARYVVAREAATDDGSRARILADLSLTLHQAGDSRQAAELAAEASALAEAAAERRAQAQGHNLVGVLARAAGDLERARSELERSLALAEQLDDQPARVAALNNLALVERDAGELDRSLELTEQALALCAAQGDRHREAALENNLADLHHAVGRPDDSMHHLKRAVAIFSEVGADEATRLPEIWKLVSW